MDKKVIGVILILAIVAVLYFVLRKKEAVGATGEAVTAKAHTFDSLVVGGVHVTQASAEDLTDEPVATQTAYASYVTYAKSLLQDPTSPQGALAVAVANSLPNPDLAIIGEIVDTGIIGPLATQNILDAGGTIEYNPNTTRGKVYYNGVFVAWTVEAKYNSALLEVIEGVSNEPITTVVAPEPKAEAVMTPDPMVAIIDNVVALTQAQGEALYGTGYGDWSEYAAGVGNPESAHYGAGA